MKTKSVSARIEDVKMPGEGDDGGPGGFTAIISTDALDRDGEVMAKGWWAADGNKLPDKITVDVDHGVSVQTTVGSARPFVTAKGELAAEVTFSSIPRAQEVRTLVQEGHIDSTSVFFLNAKRYEKDGRTHIKSAELANLGIVAVPANPDALVVAGSVKSVDDDAEVVEVVETSDAATGGTIEPDGKAGDGEKRFTMAEAKELLDAAQREATLRALTAPDVVEAQLSSAKMGLSPESYLALLHGSKNVALVVVPDGVDHTAASVAAQKAVDEMFSAAAPDAATPSDEAPAAKAAADTGALAGTRAEARQAMEAAAHEVAYALWEY